MAFLTVGVTFLFTDLTKALISWLKAKVWHSSCGEFSVDTGTTGSKALINLA